MSEQVGRALNFLAVLLGLFAAGCGLTAVSWARAANITGAVELHLLSSDQVWWGLWSAFGFNFMGRFLLSVPIA